jgi:hypothetical protein
MWVNWQVDTNLILQPSSRTGITVTSSSVPTLGGSPEQHVEDELARKRTLPRLYRLYDQSDYSIHIRDIRDISIVHVLHPTLYHHPQSILEDSAL